MAHLPDRAHVTFTAFNSIVRRLARGQHGVVTRVQLLAADVPGHVIDRRLRTGDLERLHRGVYFAGAVRPPFANEMAACLACGPHAYLSHRSAGVLWKLLKEGARPPSVEVALRRGFRRRPGIRIHQPAHLERREVTRHLRIPVTTPARTLMDLAAVLSSRQLERAVAETLALRLTSPARLRRLAQRHAKNPASQRIEAIVSTDGPAFTRSRAEERFLELIDRVGVERPKVNRRLLSYEVDFYWPGSNLVVEIDGHAYHSSRLAFERDRRRDAELVAAGFRVVRLTWRQLDTEPEGVLFRLGGALRPVGKAEA